MPNVREKLRKLFVEADDMCDKQLCKDCAYNGPHCWSRSVADYLVKNGVTIKTTKVKVKRIPAKKEITQDTLNALAAMGRKAHGGL